MSHMLPHLMIIDKNTIGTGVGRTNSKVDKVTINLEEQEGEPVEEGEIKEDDECELDDENDSNFDNSSVFESGGVNVYVHDDNQYGSDVHEEFGEYREVLRKYRRKMSERPKDKGDINLRDAGIDSRFDELRAESNENRYEGLAAADKPYFGSSDAESFASDEETEYDEEHKRKIDAKKRKKYDI
ncbi:hypothetical protein A4A49_36968 [Nicotiana attenuata]|uniref:Uncharacterized protein n=1 Tax=Nicotiana attenuata TaxID=49451 RepID=A0A1J6J0C7_NICAT|nr:hypothetical protein A4A49_36968 [Nicotiana attenuata]